MSKQMKCTIKFSNGAFVTVKAEDCDMAMALARVELIKRGDKNWKIHAVNSIQWDNKDTHNSKELGKAQAILKELKEGMMDRPQIEETLDSLQHRWKYKNELEFSIEGRLDAIKPVCP